MKTENLIKSVVSHIVTHNRGKVTLRQRNIMSRLTAYNHSKERQSIDNATDELRFRKYKFTDSLRHVFPACNYLIRNLNEAVFFVWAWLVYKLPVRIRRLWNKSTPEGYYAANPRLNFWLLSLMLCATILCVGYCLQFFVNDLLLFSQTPYSNVNGALIIEQPLHRTHHIYMYNSADYWTDTGIEITKGDKVYVTASGSFFNDILEQTKAAEQNLVLEPMRLINIPETDLSNSAYNASDPMKESRVLPTEEYGAILFSITPETKKADEISDDKDAIHSLRLDLASPVIFTADNSGKLKLCINDIYFTDENIDRLLADATATSKLEAKLGFSEKPDSVAKMRKTLKENRDLWFRDNNGEILLNIIVEHNLLGGSQASLSNRIVSGIFRPINDLVDPPVSGATDVTSIITISAIVLFLVADAIVGILIRRCRIRRRKN